MSKKTYQKLTYLDNGKIGNIIKMDFGLSSYTVLKNFEAQYSFDQIPYQAAVCGNNGETKGYGTILWGIWEGTRAKTTGYVLKYKFTPKPQHILKYSYQISGSYWQHTVWDMTDYSYNTATVNSAIYLDGPWYLFAGKKGEEVIDPCVCKFYSLVMGDGTNGFKLIPVKRLSDGVCGVLDTIHNKFYCATENVDDFIGPIENIFYDENGKIMTTTLEGLEHIKETKALLKEALKNKGVEISDSDSFRSYVEKINNTEMGLDTSDATAIAEDLLEGQTAYARGEKITGIIPNNGNLEYMPSDEEQSIPKGFTTGGTVKAADITTLAEYEACLTLANSIEDLDDYSDTTATAEDILEGKIAYSNGERIIGELKSSSEVVVSATEPTGVNRKLIWIQKGKNQYNAATDVEYKGYYSDYLNQGRPTVMAGHDIIKLILKPNTEYVVSSDIRYTVYHNLCFYDKDMNFIAGYAWNTEDKTFITPENCKYVRFTARDTRTWLQVEEGKNITEYEEFIQPTIWIKNTEDKYVILDRYTDFEKQGQEV